MRGCPSCFPAEPTAMPALEHEASLVDEVHFLVSLGRCAACGQRFVSVFCERIDWVGGEDPQTRSVLPITGEEADRLLADGAALDRGYLEALGRDRDYLLSWWPSDGARDVRVHRGGPVIVPHD